MVDYILIRYLHFISICTMIACLFLEYFLLKKQNNRNEITTLWKIDGIYGVSSISTLTAGFLLWFVVGKPASFYENSYLIWGKIGLFLIVGILSIVPTIFFFRERTKDREGSEQVDVPVKLKKYILAELILLFLIPVLAVFMAQGYGNM